MNASPPLPGWRGYLAALVVAAALAAGTAYSVTDRQFAQPMWQRVRRGEYVHYRARLFAAMDRFYREQVPAGNVLIRFVGFRQPVGSDGSFIFEQFGRANYALWPRQVFFAEPRTAWRDVDDILAQQSTPPSDVELRTWGVTTVITFDRARGTPAVEIRRLAPRLPPGGGQR